MERAARLRRPEISLACTDGGNSCEATVLVREGAIEGAAVLVASLISLGYTDGGNSWEAVKGGKRGSSTSEGAARLFISLLSVLFVRPETCSAIGSEHEVQEGSTKGGGKDAEEG